MKLTWKEEKTMIRTDDPLRDFERWDEEQALWLAKRPICSRRQHRIQDDHYYLIEDEPVCRECLESDYRKEIED